MQKLFYLSIVGCFLALSLSAQNNSLPKTSVMAWESMLEVCGVDVLSIYKACPSLPRFEEMDDERFQKAVHEWQVSKKNEVTALFDVEAVKNCNPSPFHLGISMDNIPKKFYHSFWLTVQQSGLSKTELNEIAPHLPVPVLTGDADADFDAYNIEYSIWQQVYCPEYEALINCKKMAAQNPYYNGYVVVAARPFFMGLLKSELPPHYIDTGDELKDRVKHQLSLQNWYFVFRPNEFESQYGYFPTNISKEEAESYRVRIKKKIEEYNTKNQKPELN